MAIAAALRRIRTRPFTELLPLLKVKFDAGCLGTSVTTSPSSLDTVAHARDESTYSDTREPGCLRRERNYFRLNSNVAVHEGTETTPNRVRTFLKRLQCQILTPLTTDRLQLRRFESERYWKNFILNLHVSDH